MTLKVDVVQNTSGGPVTLTDQATAKNWSHIQGSGTVSILGSFGTSSVSDNGTGRYIVNFSNTMSDAYWAGSVARDVASSGHPMEAINTRATTYTELYSARSTSGGMYDSTPMFICVGDLA
jgi:hypothetical protein